MAIPNLNPRLEMHRLVALLVAWLGLFGCTQVLRPAPAPKPEMRSPVGGVALALESPAVSIRKGTLVGGKALNPKSAYQTEFRFAESFRLSPDELNFSLKDELVSQGYMLAVRNASARWVVRPTIVRVVFNSFGSDATSGWSEAEVQVEWRLSGPRQVTVRTVGVANARKHTRAALFDAWRRAIRAFGGHPQVVEALRTNVGAGLANAVRTGPNGVARVIQRVPASATLLADDVLARQARRSVVTIVARDRFGSGTVISSTGLVLTARAVVHGVPNVQVVDANGRKYSGRIVAIDPPTGTALIQLAPGNYRPIAVRESDNALGERVTAFGTPFHPALSRSVSAGVVVSAPPGELETNLVVNDANLGGPLLDGHGRMVGVVTGRSRGETSVARGVTSRAAFAGLNISIAGEVRR